MYDKLHIKQKTLIQMYPEQIKNKIFTFKK